MMLSFTWWVAFHLAVTSPRRLDVQTDLFQERLYRPDVTADVVVTDKRYIVRGLWLSELPGLDNVVADSVVTDMVPQRLGDPAEPLAVAGDDRDIEILAGGLGHRVDVVTD
jgi:hypothetical protein